MENEGHLTGSQQVLNPSDISSLAGLGGGTYHSPRYTRFFSGYRFSPTPFLNSKARGRGMCPAQVRAYAKTPSGLANRLPVMWDSKGVSLRAPIRYAEAILFFPNLDFVKENASNSIAVSGAVLETRQVVALSGCMEVFLELPESALVRYPSKITVRTKRFKRAPVQRIGGIPPDVLVAATVV